MQHHNAAAMMFKTGILSVAGAWCRLPAVMFPTTLSRITRIKLWNSCWKASAVSTICREYHWAPRLTVKYTSILVNADTLYGKAKSTSSGANDCKLGYAFTPLDYSKAPSGEKLLQYLEENDVNKFTSALALGTNPNYRDLTGDAILHLAVKAKNEVLVKYLIVFGADLQQKNSKSLTALDIAQSQGSNNIVKIIKDMIDAQKELEIGHEEKTSISSLKEQSSEVSVVSNSSGKDDSDTETSPEMSHTQKEKDTRTEFLQPEIQLT